MSVQDAPTMSRNSADAMAAGLGWFSLGLGALEVAAPDAVARFVGMKGSENLVRAYGLREIGAGLGILGSANPEPWVWSRVAGDGLDIATLMPALRQDNPNRGNAAVALAAVLGATLVDVVCAQALRQQNARKARRQERAVRDYSRRSGYPCGIESARGAGRDFDLPRDFRIPAPLRPWKDGEPAAPAGRSAAAGHPAA